MSSRLTRRRSFAGFFALHTFGVLVAVLSLAVSAGCSQYKRTATSEEGRTALEAAAAETLDVFKQADPSMQRFFNTAHGYAVFPVVAKGAAGIGAAHGDGVVYEQGQVVGYAELTQGTLGVQLGGQTYREIIFFENDAALTLFKQGGMEFSAQASAVAAEKGAASNADFDQGVAVFTKARGGLMFEASVGGQRFTYRPK